MRDRVSPGMAAAAAVVVGLAIVALLFGFTAISTEDEAALHVEFDPAAYVDGVWNDIQVDIKEQAVPLADVLNRVEPNAEGKASTEALTPVAEELGLITTGEAHVYRVTATGTVTDVDTSTSKGTIGLDVDGYDGPIEVRAYIGRRIPSDESSIRDASGFIKFGDFRDQTQYGKVAADINKKVLQGLGSLDPDNLEGQRISLTGAFTIRTFNQPEIDVSEVRIVPIEIETL